MESPARLWLPSPQAGLAHPRGKPGSRRSKVAAGERRTVRWREMDSNHRSPARKSRFLLRKANCGTEREQPKRVVSYAVPMVRIHLPPGDSQSLSRSRFRWSRTPLFRAGLGSWLGDRVSRDAPGFPLRANRRQYLCRAIFQYRSADEVVSENAAPVPTKLGLLRGERAWIFEFGSGLSKAEHDPLIVPGKRQT